MTIENLVIPSLDQYPITASLYHPSRRNQANALIVIAGATGVPRGFYRRFAQASADKGFSVLTFDYRGIGDSKNGSLKGFEMDYRDWAEKDLAGVLEYAKELNLPIYLIGHSYGGHAIGLLPDVSFIRGAWTFGTGAGWHGWMPKREQLRVKIMWHLAGPLITRLYGYLAWSKLGMGEDLPLNVYKQWKHWCSFPNYFFDDPAMQGVADRFDRVSFPVVAVNSTDDDWATPASRDAFMNNYRNAQLQLRTIQPEGKKRSIGHMGYFKQHSQELWDSLHDWITAHQMA